MYYYDYYRRYRRFGVLSFPRTERTYFDYLSTEFSDNSKEQKLLDIAYLLWNGYDVRSDIHLTYSDGHLSVSQQNVRQTIYILLAELWGGRPEYVEQMFRNKSMDGIIDELFTALLRYYHIPINIQEPHYLKDPLIMTEVELRVCNPWREVAGHYDSKEFLLSDKNCQVCAQDIEMLKQFNASAKPEHEYHLNVPAFPWYGNPLKAKVIALSLNPAYTDRQAKMMTLFKLLPDNIINGFTEHLRSMLTFDCDSFLPKSNGKSKITSLDIANIHQNYYWYDRLVSAFVDKNRNISFERINDRFAIIQFVGYSSKKYKPFKNGQILPSQNYTKQVIQYILHNNTDTVFIVPRAEKIWKAFLGSLWDDSRFFVSNLPISQRFSASSFGNGAYEKIIEAFGK